MAKVLVIDDEPDLRFLLRRFLEAAGHEISEAHNGAVALRILDEHEVDVVIVDTVMPVMDGPAFVRELQQRGRPPVPVIVWSDVPDPRIEADEVFAKPYGGDGITVAVDRLARKVRQWNA